MRWFSALVLLGIVDAAGIIGAGLMASKLADRPLPGFAKSVIGVLSGVVAELVRVGLAFGVMSLVYASTEVPDGIVPWLAGFRIVGIPILVGIGFMAGSAAGPQAVSGSGSGETVTDEVHDPSEALAADAEPAAASHEGPSTDARE